MATSFQGWLNSWGDSWGVIGTAPPTGFTIKYFDGATWRSVTNSTKIYNGSAWVLLPSTYYTFNGTTWS